MENLLSSWSAYIAAFAEICAGLIIVIALLQSMIASLKISFKESDRSAKDTNGDVGWFWRLNLN